MELYRIKKFGAAGQCKAQKIPQGISTEGKKTYICWLSVLDTLEADSKKSEKAADILIIYTGGTIGMLRDLQTQALQAFDFDRLLDQLPELQELNYQIDFYSFDHPIDSSEISPADWIALAEVIEQRYERYDGFVVLHGSDTMAYSASALSLMLEHLSKPIIFTGSQLPIGALRTDAIENLITALQFAGLQQDGKPLIREVGLYFGYKLLRANRCTKVNAAHFKAFDSPNFPPLAESGIQLSVNEALLLRGAESPRFNINKVLNTHIALIKLFPGISPSFLRSALQDTTIKGVILETYGSGNAITQEWFLELLRRAVDNGLKIVNVTQCIGGSVALGLYETSRYMKSLGISSGHDITTESALAKMMLLLPHNYSNDDFKKNFERPMAGELSVA